ncbi:hypothetical protein PTI98_006292 [Pleurotus ostreatus]|nr:hypothetical protein PTI98_006292 [Pleurotus ostreatus]
MSASNPKGSLPASYRFKEVYVDIPPSPYHTPRASKLSIGPRTGSAIIPSVRLKENSNSMRASMQQTPVSKRKLDNVPSVEISIPSAKRTKLSSSATSLASLQSMLPAQNQENTAPGNVSSEFYCHQCNRKYNKEDAVDCFGITAKGRCMAKYCKRCLINRYGEDAGHLKIAEAGTYKCPRCRGVCNCSRCRKAQGLAPLGKMAPVGVNNASTAVGHDLSGKEKQIKAKSSTVQISSASASASKVEKSSSVVRKPKPKAPPSLKWKAVPTDLNYEQALLRFEIREFVLRFGILFPFPLSKSHMEELNAVEGKYGSTGDEEDYEPLHGWVSEGCIKSIILGLLGFLVDDKPAAVAKAIKLAMKDIRSCGANLSKLWAVLAGLRDVLGRDTFPDPLPGPEVSVRMTRNTHVDEARLTSVAFAAQLVPVVVALQEATMTSSRIRKEIDEGVQSSKDMVKDARELSKKEAERWEQQKKDIASAAKGGKEATLKAARQEHKQHLQKLDGMTKILSHAYTPRSGYLGQDAEGRTYWALSPGMPEREEALAFLEACKEVEGKGKKAKGRRSAPSVANGEELEDWSWFVAVWGSEPRNAGAKSKPDDEEDAWWGIWEPAEIRKLSQWLTSKYRLDEEDETPAAKDSWWAQEGQKTIRTNSLPSKHELESLVKGLDEYATVLQWRIEKARDEA